jgi:hypothetical protein
VLYTMRIWLPDRPGALGAVASRIGAVRGDLVGIDILERGGGMAVDELVVDLPSAELVDLLVSEVSEVDGVEVEDLRPAGSASVDPRLDALETAASLVGSHSVELVLSGLAELAVRDFDCEWAGVVDPETGEVARSVGPVPPGVWLRAFLAGSRASSLPDDTPGGPEDVAWADLDAAGLVAVLGRRGRPFRSKERRQLSALARIADVRWAELACRSGRGAHPSQRQLRAR